MSDAFETDVLIIGSGAGALTAGVTAADGGARVLVVEKSDRYGGTSAMSGGGIWIPASENAKQLGVEDSTEEAYRYMKSMIGDQVADARIRRFVDKAPEMLAYLQRSTHVRYDAIPYPDYYPEQPGAKRGFRTQSPRVFNGAKIGDEMYAMREQPPGALAQGRYTMSIPEARKFLTQTPGWRLTLLKVVILYYLDIRGRLRGKRSRRLTQGNALVGSLYQSFRERGGEIWLESPMRSLIEEDGGITGAIVERNGKEIRVHAKRGVILAAGGFENNKAMREASLPAPTDPDWTASQEHNTGDAIRAGVDVGATTDLMGHAWWIPVVHVPGWPRAMGIFAERSLPGLVIVNRLGRRFANEALPYLESGQAMYEADSVPSWVVFDANFRKKYPFGPLGPGWAMPDKFIPRKVRKLLTVADSIEALAEKLGMDAAGLADTIARNNEFARTGKDTDFQRGDSFYDQYYGDARHGPNPCIATIDAAPFYALPLHPGDIGTKGGLLTDEDARVLSESGEPLPGLYAVGNTSASVMGDKYVGAGATLGPAMTFGYVAARHILEERKDGQTI
jgi:3-oxosteroid 1-dehydrogenase